MQAQTTYKAPVFRGRIPYRVLGGLDLMGLVALIAVFIMRDPAPGAQSLYLTLLVVSIGVWLMGRQVRTLATILVPSPRYTLAAPGVAVVVVLLLRLVTGEYVSSSGLLTFAAAWTAWMVMWRILRSSLRPPTRILAIGSAAILNELRNDPRVVISVAEVPPDDFEGIDVVAIDPAVHHSDDWLRWLLHADMAGVRTIAAPLILETLAHKLPLDALQGKWARFLVSERRPYVDWKRVVDVAVVVALAPVWLTVLLIVILAVYIEDGRPVIFWQLRSGRYKRPFWMAKVRSMQVGADANGPTFADDNDPRITRVGRFIRKYRLDELAQVWNVLKGDMSLIGPRPEQIEFSEEFEARFPLYSLRYHVRPGITGWAQVCQGYAADAEENYAKLRYDLYYVRHVSPLLDLWITARTMLVVLNGFGAR